MVQSVEHSMLSLQRDTYCNLKRGTLKERCRDADQSGQDLDLLLLFVVV